jgi:hypothetical protein
MNFVQFEYKEKRRHHLTRNESIFIDSYDDNDDELLSAGSFKEIHRRPAVVDILNRQESDSVPDSFLPNITTGSTSSSLTVYRSTSCSDNNSSASLTSDPVVGSSNSIGGSLDQTVLQRPRSATVLSSAESANMASSFCVSLSPSPSDDIGTEAASRPGQLVDHSESISKQSSNSDEAENETNNEERTEGLYRPRVSQRRNGRSERRYYTADTIREIEKRRESQDSGIHKRLSLNYSGNGSGNASKASCCRSDDDVVDRSYDPSVCSADSMHSVRSSSGVSSAASLCRGATTGTDEISEETVDDVIEGDCAHRGHVTEPVDRDVTTHHDNCHIRDNVNDECGRLLKKQPRCSVSNDDDYGTTDHRQTDGVSQDDVVNDEGSVTPTSRIRRRPTPAQMLTSKSGRLALAAENIDIVANFSNVEVS